MTDEEFDIIDELYFVTAFADLQTSTGYSDQQLKVNLKKLVEKGWVRLYETVDEESEIDHVNFENDFKAYFYLASKKGLFEHNSQ